MNAIFSKPDKALAGKTRPGMKTVAAALFFLICGFSAFAQSGIEVGYLNARYSSSVAGFSRKGAPLNGFYAGVSDEFRLVAGLGIHVGLNYSYSTDKSVESIVHDRFDIRGSETDHYLNLPVRLRYNFKLLPGVIQIQAFAGPVFSLGLKHTYDFNMSAEVGPADLKGVVKYNYYTGKLKSDSFSDEELADMSGNMPEGFQPDGVYRRGDIYMGGGVGIELFGLIEFKAGYDWGLLNRYKGAIGDNAECKRNTFYFTLGFRF